jgi:hypothetical protein
MTHANRGHYAKKHPEDRKVNPDVAAAVKKKAANAKIACAVAFTISSHLNVPPAEVGFTADFFEIPITKCQLGLFGYHPIKKNVKPAESVSGELEDEIRAALVNGKLPCAAAWEIAGRSGIHKMKVASACEALKIKIITCQLGAF